MKVIIPKGTSVIHANEDGPLHVAGYGGVYVFSRCGQVKRPRGDWQKLLGDTTYSEDEVCQRCQQPYRETSVMGLLMRRKKP